MFRLADDRRLYPCADNPSANLVQSVKNDACKSAIMLYYHLILDSVLLSASFQLAVFLSGTGWSETSSIWVRNKNKKFVDNLETFSQNLRELPIFVNNIA